MKKIINLTVFRKKVFLFAIFLLMGILLIPQIGAAQTNKIVNIYSARQPFLIQPLLKKFTEAEGIEVRIVFAKSGIVERLLAEGKNSPADVILTSGSGLLFDIVDKNLAQPALSEVLETNIPSYLRSEDNLWFALTSRARIFYVSVAAGPKLDFIKNYQDLTSGRLSGKVCIRSGYHPYNIALFSWLIAEKGERWFRGWIKKLKGNLARKPQGNDRAQAKAIREGLCEVAIGNSYYYGAMVNNTSAPEQKQWAKAIKLVFPNQATRGTHINISGAALAVHAPNKQNGIKLLEFLSGQQAQLLYAEVNYEFPTNPNVPFPKKVTELSKKFKASQRTFSEINQFRRIAVYILDEIKFDK